MIKIEFGPYQMFDGTVVQVTATATSILKIARSREKVTDQKHFREKDILVLFRDIMRVSNDSLQAVTYEVFTSSVFHEGKQTPMFKRL